MSTTLGPMVPSLTGSSTCLFLTVSVPAPALMDPSNATGDPIRDDSRRKSPEKGIWRLEVGSTTVGEHLARWASPPFTPASAVHGRTGHEREVLTGLAPP